jgi:hypothetical protein
MAFATTNVQKSVFGNLNVTLGDWSSAAGDTAGSVAVSGGRVYAALFSSQDSSGAQVMWPVKVSSSVSGAVTTLTVYNLGDVTAGRFLIIHKG